MSGKSEKAAAWIYEGIWGALSRAFRVPRQPPTLPAAGGGRIDSFRPCPQFLSYLKLPFWIALTIIDGLIMIGWVVLLIFEPLIAMLVLPIVLIIAIVPDLFAYVALHLRYDTTWYVMSDRSIRIRRGVWTIVESTISFENIQNVKMTQGPIQRYFGFANLTVETAGGGASHGKPAGTSSNTHVGHIEGLEDAQRIRDQIMAKVRASRSAGLGDESDEHAHLLKETKSAWSDRHVAVLRDILDDLRGLSQSPTTPAA